jgi:lysine 2,3-aminomutase
MFSFQAAIRWCWPPKLLDMILARLRAIPHVEIIRIGSRVPVFLPMRVTEEFCEMVSKYHPFWLNIHVNHHKEVTPELAAACDRLSRAGVPLGNQSVLLAGVNDSVHLQRKLVHELVKIRVRPYYLYQCDLVEGSGHLRTSVARGIEIIEGLRGHTSGYAVPTYVVDAPGGGGKIPVMPNYVVSQAPGRLVLRNFEGFMTTYSEPLDYDPREIHEQERLIARRPEPGQEGVLALLEGERMTIEPEGFSLVHARGGLEHRLRSGDIAKKWQPLGVGVIDPAPTMLSDGEEESQ